ncbi:hypothetical protein CEXT_800761 [Caerostris extrusa]|uniref:Uncharacterized protein n=1 Tax=Caerostris extrusa TaxID=172846 RepID=A0AAV4PX17_CAEEX|nr:hypothetical protein CEXT_800761 [Caerostris extrusa]
MNCSHMEIRKTIGIFTINTGNIPFQKDVIRRVVDSMWWQHKTLWSIDSSITSGRDAKSSVTLLKSGFEVVFPSSNNHSAVHQTNAALINIVM